MQRSAWFPRGVRHRAIVLRHELVNVDESSRVHMPFMLECSVSLSERTASQTGGIIPHKRGFVWGYTGCNVQKT